MVPSAINLGQAQAAVLATFTEAVEWLAHTLAATCGMRPNEVRAVSPSDYQGRDAEDVPWLKVTKAMPTLSWDGQPTHTKNRRNRTIPIPDDVAEMIEVLWPAQTRLAADPAVPMVWNPRTRRRWSHWALRESWLRGCKAAGLPPIPLYEGTKHSGATDMLARTKDLDAVQRYLGHRDRRSTELYAKVQDTALIEIARRPCLHPACSEKTSENPFLNHGLMASPTGLEPPVGGKCRGAERQAR